MSRDPRPEIEDRPQSAEPFPIQGLRPPKAPESLRAPTLAAAMRALRGEERTETAPRPGGLDAWLDRLWPSPAPSLAWAAILVVLLAANLAPPGADVGPPTPRFAGTSAAVGHGTLPFNSLPLDEARLRLEESGLL